MPNLTRRIAATAAAAAVATPVGLALAADEGPPRASTPSALTAPLAGHRTVAGQMRAELRDRLLAEHGRLLRRAAALDGRSIPAAARLARRADPRDLRTGIRRLREDIRMLDVPTPPVLERIAACESGGDPRAIGGGGAYRGKYQFSVSTWQAVGGEGDPAAAPEAEQDRRAAMLLERSGAGQWPVCGG